MCVHGLYCEPGPCGEGGGWCGDWYEGPGAVCAVCRRGALRLGIATGVLFGLSAALTKATVERLDDGVLHALLDWHAFALVIVGFVSVALSQASLRAGSLGTAVAAQMSLDAISSLFIGVFAFGESLHTSAIGGAGALAGVALAIAGIAVLAAATEPTSAPPRIPTLTPVRA